MAKKTRTPPPPRPGQGPMRRDSPPAPRRPADARNRRILVLGAGGAALVALAVVLVLVFTGGSGASLEKTLKAAGCSVNSYPVTDRHHVASLTTKVKYPSFPGVGGPHFGQTAPWGRYPTPLVEIQKVHNLEHGGVVIQYGDQVAQTTVSALGSLLDASPNGMLMAPLPALGKKIALEAWTADAGKLAATTTGGYQGVGRLALCTSYDEKAFTRFRDAYRGKGPERFPVSSLTPGT